MKQEKNKYKIHTICLHYDDYRYFTIDKEPWFLLKDILRATVVWRMNEAVMPLDKDQYMRVSTGGVMRERYFIRWDAIDALFNDYVRKDTRFEASLSSRLAKALNEDITLKNKPLYNRPRTFNNLIPIIWYLADRKLFVTRMLTQYLHDKCVLESTKKGIKLHRISIPDCRSMVDLFDSAIIDKVMNDLFIWDTERNDKSLPVRVQLKAKYVKGDEQLNYLTINDYIELKRLSLTQSQYNYARVKCNQIRDNSKPDNRSVSHIDGGTANIYDERLINKAFGDIYRQAQNHPSGFSYQSVKAKEE